MKNILLSQNNSFTLYPLTKDLTIHQMHISLRDDIVFLNDKQLNLYEAQTIGDKVVELIDSTEVTYSLVNNELILINDTTVATLTIGDYQLSITKNKINNPKNQLIYINGIASEKEEMNYQLGDQLKIGSVFLIINEKTITTFGNQNELSTHLKQVNPNLSHLRDFPSYHRSPRIIHRMSNEKIELASPKESEKTKHDLMALLTPPLTSLAASIAMLVFLNRGLLVIITMGTTVLTTTFSISKFFRERKQEKIEKIEKEEAYENYLLRIRKRLVTYKSKELKALAYHYPTIKTLEGQVNDYSSRIYEKDKVDEDFLHISVGTTTAKSKITITLRDNESEVKKDPRIVELREIKETYEKIEAAPQLIDMKKSHVGLVGDQEEIHDQIKQMLAQITFFHSYHDVEIILLYNERFKNTFDYTKWYPHMKISAVNARGNIYQGKIRDQVLASLTQILKQRKQARDENKKTGMIYPHYLIFIDDYSLIMNHSIMEYLQEETTELGFTVIFSAKQRADLLENIKTVVLVEDKETNRLLMREGFLIDRQVNSPQIVDVSLEKMARNLSVLNHQLGIQSRIPEKITYFDLYHIAHPKELNILQRWDKSDSHKTLSVPLGVRGENDIVYLDLHEKAHGPHGLVAGTTGSGKSETIQTYILSLATNFHPHEVGFLLIDYKGGGMADMFKNLPHLLGIITNLDGSESMRAMVSINSEIKRRQQIFREYDVNNIIKYNKLFKAGIAKEPLPSLFLISDEFAELKKEQPDFMNELITVARIGRTLGIRMILATQKPAGVVNDQIWSNSRFKLALKVADETDSKEIIKTPDAAYITQAGRTILQVGNNEIYETFQSAWSGASYQTEEAKQEKQTLVYRINEMGQAELVNTDLSLGEAGEGGATTVSQLDVTIDHIAEVYKNLNTKAVIKPWLPALKKQLQSPHIPKEVTDVSNYKKLDLSVALGVVDIPEKQAQDEYLIHFTRDGNLAYFGASGFGKTFTLGLIMMTLAVKNSPEQLEYYIVDLGNSALIGYQNLPHTADYMTFDSDEKINKFMKLITDEIKERKKQFAQGMAQNFGMYNQLNETDPLKAIFVFLDNYDIVKEMSLDFNDFMTKLARDGASLGIYLVVTATLPSSMRHVFASQFKNKISGYLYDKNDYSSVVGRVAYQLPEIKGRALVKQEEINTLQIYTPFSYDEPLAFFEKNKTYIKQLNVNYTGKLPTQIPILPETFTSNEFNLYKEEAAHTDNNISIGLCVTDVVIVDAKLFESTPYLIIGPPKSGKTNLMELIINQLPTSIQIFLFDSPTMKLLPYQQQDNLAYVTDDMIEAFLENLKDEIATRKQAFETKRLAETVIPGEFYKTLPKWVIAIDGIDTFAKKMTPFKESITLLQAAMDVEINFIMTATGEHIKALDGITKLFKTPSHGVVLGTQGLSPIFPVSAKATPIFGQGYLFDAGHSRGILLPRFNKTNTNNVNE